MATRSSTSPTRRVKDWNARLWFGVAAPAKTPPNIIAFLNATLNRILAEPDTIERLRVLGLEPRRLSPEEISQIVRDDSATFAEIIKAASIKAD
jgi:tripartite-type tricarboxylate transporter receptor subunit TctC